MAQQPTVADLARLVVETAAGLPFNRLLGEQVEVDTPGRCTVTVPFREELTNHIGTIHALGQLAPAETAGAVAVGTALADLLAGGWVPVVAGVEARWRRPAVGGVRAAASVTEEQTASARAAAAAGERVRLQVPVEVTDERGEVVCTATYEYVLLSPTEVGERLGSGTAEASPAPAGDEGAAR